MYPEGGYKTITPVQIANAFSRHAEGAINLRALRVYLACFELQAVREAAARATRPSGRRGGGRPDYQPRELARLVGASEVSIRRELRHLDRAGLVQFTPAALAIRDTPLGAAATLLAELSPGRSWTRPIPVPRRVIAYLCRCQKAALVKTALAYLVRGLSLTRTSGVVKAAGTVKATWIAAVLGLSERAVRGARAELIAVGLISRDTGSHQRKLNRDGAYFRVNLEWGGSSASSSPSASTVTQDVVVEVAGSAPLTARNRLDSAPPELKPETPSDHKNQKLAARDRAGFCGGVTEPVLRNIRPENLRRLEPLRALFRQAVAARWLPEGEASFLDFTAAAVRANRASGDAVRIFVAIVRRQLWHHITHADEERARAVIGREARRLTCQQDGVMAALAAALGRPTPTAKPAPPFPGCASQPARETLPKSAAETLRLSGTWSVTDGHRDGRHHPGRHLTSGRRGATSPVA